MNHPEVNSTQQPSDQMKKRTRPPPLDLNILFPRCKRPSTSPPKRTTQHKTHSESPYSPNKPFSPAEPTLPLDAAGRRRLLSCSVIETFHSVHSPNIQSPAIQHNSSPVIRMRTSFTYSQLQTLEETFSAQNQISQLHAHQVAGQFELPVQSITSWFSNRRYLKKKRDQRRQALLKLRTGQSSLDLSDSTNQ